MRLEELQRITDWFHRYVESFRDDGAELSPAHKLKYDHSLRVAEDSVAIAEGLGWSVERVRFAETAGLLHDVGRFSQHARYGTFRDPLSVDHGREGLKTLRESGVLSQWDEASRTEVELAVSLHNRRELPNDIQGPELDLLRLVRDADKVDILTMTHLGHGPDRDRLLHTIDPALDLGGPASPAILDSLAANVNPSYTEVRTFADVCVIHLIWLGEIEYGATLGIIERRGIVDRIRENLPDAPAVSEAVQSALHAAKSKL